jgi:large subunit ribosomal protein L15
MKLHDLRPAEGAHKPRTRVGRGIAAGKGKTAGRGTKGQKARAGGSIPPWFEGGQTPLHMRIPKLKGFKNRFRVEYEVVNVGSISELVERGAFETESTAKGAKAKASTTAQITINQDILRAVGLVRTLDKPLKILGSGELSAPLFVVADAFTASARTKIEAAGGTVSVLEVPTTKTVPLKPARVDAAPAASVESVDTADEAAATTDDTVVAADGPAPKAAKAAKAPKPPKAAKAAVETAPEPDTAPESGAAEAVEASADATTDPADPPATEASDEAETTSGDDA